MKEQPWAPLRVALMLSNKLTQGEIELLVITMEEAGELVQACSKILRFGKEHAHVANLEQETGDVLCMTDLLDQYGLVDYEKAASAAEAKHEKLRKWSDLIR
jgi:NTP pyrophosphatase (non-canonical NTP hydrolase)